MRNIIVNFLIACVIFAAGCFIWTSLTGHTADAAKDVVAAEEGKATGLIYIVLASGLGLLILAGGITILIVVLKVPIHWYVAGLLAQRDFIFTNVPESYFKEVVRFGGHRKTLLSKEGHKIDGNGDIVPFIEGEEPEASLPGGLRLVGWPFIDTIYRRDMKFQKSLSNGEVKTYEVEGVDKFYARVAYSYALLFVKCEDKNNLPLTGHATLLARVVNPVKSNFATANFYDTMIGLVLPVVRKRLEKFTYDELREKPDLDQLMWGELNKVQPAGLVGTEDDINVLDELYHRYGVEIVAFRIVDINPQDEELRKIGLAKWRAEREADAAKHQAEASATLFDDTNRALKIWLKDNPKATQAQIEAKQDELRQRALAKTPGYQQIHIKGLENASTAVVGGGGGGTGILVGGNSGKNPKKGGNPGGKGQSSKNPPGSADPPPEQQAKSYFQQHKKWPDWWDPQKNALK